MKTSIKQPSEFASDTQLAARYATSRATIWRWANEGKIPKPVKLTQGCTRWRMADLAQFEQGAAIK